MKNFDVEYDAGEEVDNQFGDGNLRANKKPNFKKTNYLQLTGGNNFYRIMPEMFGGIERGMWAIYYVRHWGFKKENQKQQPFCCVKKYDPRTRVVTHDCEFCKNLDLLTLSRDRVQKEVESLKVDLVEAESVGSDDSVEVLEARLSQKESELSDLKRKVTSPERKFWVNAMNKAGEFGLLALPKTVYEQLAGSRQKDGSRTLGLIKTLQENEGLKALDVNGGVWFNIVRTGTDQFTTEYKAEVEQEIIEVNGRKMKQAKMALLSVEEKTRALKDCVDLTTVFNHLILSDKEMLAIIGGGPAAVSASASAPRKVVAEPSKALDDQFGKSTVRGVPNGTPTSKKKSDEEILAELMSIK